MVYSRLFQIGSLYVAWQASEAVAASAQSIETSAIICIALIALGALPVIYSTLRVNAKSP